MIRGRLINRFQAVFGILDPGSMTYDDVFREPVEGREGRSETTVTLPVQVEDPSWFRSAFGYAGLEHDGEISLILHFEDLENAGLLDSNGNSLINIGARVIEIRRNDGVPVRSFPEPPGMYVIQARESSFGLEAFGTPNRNLLFLLCAPRQRVQSRV